MKGIDGVRVREPERNNAMCHRGEDDSSRPKKRVNVMKEGKVSLLS